MLLCNRSVPNRTKYRIITVTIYRHDAILDILIRLCGLTSSLSISISGSMMVISILSNLYSIELRMHPLNIQNDMNAHINNPIVSKAYICDPKIIINVVTMGITA